MAGYLRVVSWSKPLGRSTVAPMYIGWPQNLERSSLLILMRLTQRVSNGTDTSGSFLVSASVIGVFDLGSNLTWITSLTRLPGDLLNCWPSHWSLWTQITRPSARLNFV